MQFLLLVFLAAIAPLVRCQDIVAQDCFGDDLFSVVSDEVDFDNARELCRSIEENTFVARIKSFDEFFFVNELARVLPDPDAWVGKLIKPLEHNLNHMIGLIGDPEVNNSSVERFSLDGNFTDSFPFFEDEGALPWAFDQPDNFGGEEDCVV